MHITRRIGASLALAASVALVAAGCSTTGGGSPTGDATDGGGALTTVHLGAIPVADIGAVVAGQEQGFFKEQGLNINIEYGSGGAALIPALLNGQYDIIFAGTVSALQAIEQGIPLRGIAPVGYSSGVHGHDTAGVLVKSGSPIKSAKDLEGKTIALNAVKGYSEVLTRQAVINDGGDPSKVNYIEMALPDMLAALDAGQVDAIGPSEPFLTMGEQAGDSLIVSLPVDVDPQFLNGDYIVTEDTLKNKPDLITKFDAALKDSFAYVTANPDKMREAIGSYSQIDPTLLQQIGISQYTWTFPVDATLRQAQWVKAAGYLKDPEGSTKTLYDGVPTF